MRAIVGADVARDVAGGRDPRATLTPAIPPDCSKVTSVFADAAAGAAASATMSAKGRGVFMHARLPNDGPR